MAADATPQVLCRLDEIPDGEARGFTVGNGADQQDILVVRDGTRVFGYVNVCPHTGTPLDMEPDAFMSDDGGYIMCHTHGALFEIADGACIAGPCAGDELTSIEVTVDGDGRVLIADA